SLHPLLEPWMQEVLRITRHHHSDQLNSLHQPLQNAVVYTTEQYVEGLNQHSAQYPQYIFASAGCRCVAEGSGCPTGKNSVVVRVIALTFIQSSGDRRSRPLIAGAGG